MILKHFGHDLEGRCNCKSGHLYPTVMNPIPFPLLKRATFHHRMVSMDVLKSQLHCPNAWIMEPLGPVTSTLHILMQPATPSGLPSRPPTETKPEALLSHLGLGPCTWKAGEMCKNLGRFKWELQTDHCQIQIERYH